MLIMTPIVQTYLNKVHKLHKEYFALQLVEKW